MWLVILCFFLLLIFICYFVWIVLYRYRSYNKEVDIIIVLGVGIFIEFVILMFVVCLDCVFDIY